MLDLNPEPLVGHPSASVVYIVDDDQDVREALSSLCRSVGLHVEMFGSADALLQAERADIPSCLVLDIRLPVVNGLDFQAQLAKTGIHMPIVFMTGHGDIPMSVRAMKAGAVDFLTKPVRDQDLLDAVYSALESDRKRRSNDDALSELASLYETLSSREKEIMGFVTKGLMNKQIAAELGLSEITVKIHRGNVMRKMKMRSVPDLVRAAERIAFSKVAS